MAGSSFGKIFVVTTFGESHGVALGAIVERRAGRYRTK